ncbi:MAG TPA: (d)CMP kinase [Candidatus Binataceae bacterium]|nr:(d)CMP kinase [Candidatus Binataceae bacterium]
MDRMTGRARPVIAIDGPVGAGKSTVARALARVLGFTYLNTGAMYRAVAIAARARGLDPDDPALAERLAAMLEKVSITFDGERVLLDGHDVSGEIGAPAVGDLASRLSTLAVVRARMRVAQRAAGRDGGIVMEGRDIGTAIFPDAEFKFFLTADVNVRAQRRFAELAAKGERVTFAAVLAELRERDRRDQERELAPLRQAADAIEIDATALSASAVVAAMKSRIDQALRGEKDLKRT